VRPARAQDGRGAEEDERERVVLVRREFLAGGRRQGSGGFLAMPTRLIAAKRVGQAAGGDGDQPAPRVVRDSLVGPLECGGEQRLLHGVLAEVEVAVATDERAEDLRRQLTQQVLRAGSGRRAHISVPASFMTGRTSTAQNRAAGSCVTISAARSMLSASSR
jgi:hypothetical protein